MPEEDKEFDERIKRIDEAFHAWLEKQNNLLMISEYEALGNCWFDAYEWALKDIKDADR